MYVTRVIDLTNPLHNEKKIEIPKQKIAKDLSELKKNV